MHLFPEGQPIFYPLPDGAENSDPRSYFREPFPFGHWVNPLGQPLRESDNFCQVKKREKGKKNFLSLFLFTFCVLIGNIRVWWAGVRAFVTSDEGRHKGTSQDFDEARSTLIKFEKKAKRTFLKVILEEIANPLPQGTLRKAPHGASINAEQSACAERSALWETTALET